MIYTMQIYSTQIMLSYVLYEDRNDDKQWSFNSILNTELADNISLDAAVNYTTLKSHNYAKVLDLLGGTSYEDKDYFDNISNNALTPGRIVGEGDTFKYNYNLDANTMMHLLKHNLSIIKLIFM